MLHAAVHGHTARKALERGRAVIAQVIPLPDIQKQAAGHAAAVEGHGQPDGCQLPGLHGLAQREQHTELGLGGVKRLGFVKRLPPGHGHVLRQCRRGTLHLRQLFQQGVFHRLGLGLAAAQHDQLNAGRAQHLVVSISELAGSQALHLFQIALLPDACRAVTKKLPVGLPLAVEALLVHFIFQRLFEHLFFNLHSFRVKGFPHKIGVERGPQGQLCVFLRQGLPLQRKLVFDARHADTEVVVGAHGAGIHSQVRPVEAGQLLGQLGHIRAVGIAALHHQRQQSMSRGGLPLCREGKMDADAAAVEFLRRVPGKVYPGRDLHSFQLIFLIRCDSLVFQVSLAALSWPRARNSSSERPPARMARAFSTPTYRQCQGAKAMPVAACRSSGQRRIKPYSAA